MSKSVVKSFMLMRGLSELCATATIMVISCMSCAANGAENPITSVTFGLAHVVVMHSFGFISGAHANPCVTITCCLLDYIECSMMILYIVCQFIGAALGYFMVLQVLPQPLLDASPHGVCIMQPLSSLSNIQIAVIEGFLTSVLLLAWSALWDVRSGRFLDSVTLRMGCLVTLCHLTGARLTGANMNPAKLLMPPLFRGNVETVLLQLGGQLVAAFAVPHMWKFAFTPRYRTLQNEQAEHTAPQLFANP